MKTSLCKAVSQETQTRLVFSTEKRELQPADLQIKIYASKSQNQKKKKNAKDSQS